MKATPQVIVITGAAHGLGRSFARHCSGLQNTLVLIDKDKAALQKTTEMLGPLNKQIITEVIDLSIAEGLKNLNCLKTNQLSKVDMLINNAGFSYYDAGQPYNPNAIFAVLQTNLCAPILISKLFLPLLLKSEAPKILNIISGIAFWGLPGYGAYAASKAGLRAFSQSLDGELSSTKIAIHEIYPGPINTTMSSRSIYTSASQKRKEQKYLQKYGVEPDILASKILTSVQAGRQFILTDRKVMIGYWMSRLCPGLLRWLIKRRPQMFPLVRDTSQTYRDSR